MIYENERLKLTDIQKLVESCLNTNYFVFDIKLTYKRYVDDSHARFEALHHQSHSFLNMLNKQNKAVQYTMKKKINHKIFFSMLQL